MKKGQLIYLVSSVMSILLLFLPHSMFLFSFEVSNIQKLQLLHMIPDILSIIVLVLTYITLRQFYKKKSLYIKLFPVYILLNIFLWTIIIH